MERGLESVEEGRRDRQHQWLWWVAGALAVGASVAAYESVQLRRRQPRQVDDLLDLCEDVTQNLLEQARRRSPMVN